jgi:hypothetical protein
MKNTHFSSIYAISQKLVFLPLIHEGVLKGQHVKKNPNLNPTDIPQLRTEASFLLFREGEEILRGL